MTSKTLTAEDVDVLFNSLNGAECNGWTRVGEQHRRTSRWHNHCWLVLRDADGDLWGVEIRLAEALGEDTEGESLRSVTS